MEIVLGSGVFGLTINGEYALTGKMGTHLMWR